MSRFTPLLLLSLLLPASAQPQRAPTTLAQLRGGNRVLLVFAAGRDDASLRLQLHTFDNAGRALSDRSIRVIALPNNAPSPTVTTLTPADALAARQHFKIAPADFTIVLVGKDGEEKFRSSKPISIDQLVQVVDAMPMRQQEMRREPH